MARVTDLTTEQINKAVVDLVRFYEFTFFYERGIDVKVGLVFALDMQVSTLGLTNDDDVIDGDDDYDSADLMHDFVSALLNHQSTLNQSDAYLWKIILQDLPYKP